MILPFVCLTDVCFIFLKGYSRSTSSTLAYLRALPQCHYDFNYLSRWTAKVHHMGRAPAGGQQAAGLCYSTRQKMSSLKNSCVNWRKWSPIYSTLIHYNIRPLASSKNMQRGEVKGVKYHHY